MKVVFLNTRVDLNLFHFTQCVCRRYYRHSVLDDDGSVSYNGETRRAVPTLPPHPREFNS